MASESDLSDPVPLFVLENDVSADDDVHEPGDAGRNNPRAATPGTVHEYYLSTNNSKKHLFLLCVGLKNEAGEKIFDIDASPFNHIKKERIRPKRAEYISEVQRRAAIFFADEPVLIPKATNWTITKCVDWLESNPLQDANDLLFVKNMVNQLRNVALSTIADEEASTTAGDTLVAKKWRGSAPYMRLIMCLVEDDVKAAYLRHADVMSREELDGRNSDIRPPSAFELLANRWNDEAFHPIAPASTCHEHFMNATDCSFDTVSDYLPATPQKVKDCLASFRTDLTRIISNWERSGQGDGGHQEESDDDREPDTSPPANNVVATVPFGALYRRTARALSTRADFLRNRPSYLLYFWDMVDQHQLLQTSMQRFSEDSGASDASSTRTDITASADSARRRRQLHSEFTSVSADMQSFSASVKSMIEAEKCRTTGQADRDDERAEKTDDRNDKRVRMTLESEEIRLVKQRINGLEDMAREYRRKYAEADDVNSRSAKFYLDEANEIRSQIETLQQSLMSTPQRGNRTPGSS